LFDGASNDNIDITTQFNSTDLTSQDPNRRSVLTWPYEPVDPLMK